MSLINQVREKKRALKADLEQLLQKRDFGPADQARFDAGVEKVKEFDARIDELLDDEIRHARAASHNLELGVTEPGGSEARWSVSSEPQVYRDPHKDSSSPSFFRDLRNSRLGDYQAMERLQRNEQTRQRETRAGDMTTVAGAGGQFAPPAWIVDEFVALARPSRVAANLATHMELPSGVSSVNLPKVATGSTTAIQATQNTALSDTAATTTAVTSGISTIGGKQIVARQLLDQAGTEFDRVILGDLAADYAKQLDLQYLAGSGASGQLKGLGAAGYTGTTFTTATPAVTSATAANSFYNKLISAANTIQTTRFLPPSAILMHPQRWNWVLEGLDTATRPLVVPDGPVFNAVGSGGTPTAQGAAGTLLGLPVFVDPNITVTNNTNQDIVYVGRFEDVFLWESPLRMESFDATYADQASILFRVMAYSALIPDRYTSAVSLISGTGLISPTL